MISLEEIIKQNSLLPPIIDTSHQLLGQAAQNNRFSNLPAVNRPNNFSLASSKRKQMNSLSGVNTASALNNNHYSAMQQPGIRAADALG